MGAEGRSLSKFYPICFVAIPELDVPWEAVHAQRQECLPCSFYSPSLNYSFAFYPALCNADVF